MCPCQALGWMLGTQRWITQMLCSLPWSCSLQSTSASIILTLSLEIERSPPLFPYSRRINWTFTGLFYPRLWHGRARLKSRVSDSSSRALSAGEFLYCQLKSSKLFIFPAAPGFYLAAQFLSNVFPWSLNGCVYPGFWGSSYILTLDSGTFPAFLVRAADPIHSFPPCSTLLASSIVQSPFHPKSRFCCIPESFLSFLCR